MDEEVLLHTKLKLSCILYPYLHVSDVQEGMKKIICTDAVRSYALIMATL